MSDPRTTPFVAPESLEAFNTRDKELCEARKAADVAQLNRDMAAQKMAAEVMERLCTLPPDVQKRIANHVQSWGIKRMTAGL